MVNEGMDKDSKHFLDDDSGIAWGLAAVFLLIFIGGLIYIYMTPIFNSLIAPINTYIGMGLVSQNTADAATFGQYVIVFIPVVMILGFFAWIIVRAHDRSDQL